MLWSAIREGLTIRARRWGEHADRLAAAPATMPMSARFAELAAAIARVRVAVTDDGVLDLPLRPEAGMDDLAVSASIERSDAEWIIAFAAGETTELLALLDRVWRECDEPRRLTFRRAVGRVVGIVYTDVIRTVGNKFPDLAPRGPEGA